MRNGSARVALKVRRVRFASLLSRTGTAMPMKKLPKYGAPTRELLTIMKFRIARIIAAELLGRGRPVGRKTRTLFCRVSGVAS